jgi:hypothetical protein
MLSFPTKTSHAQLSANRRQTYGCLVVQTHGVMYAAYDCIRLHTLDTLHYAAVTPGPGHVLESTPHRFV